MTNKNEKFDINELLNALEEIRADNYPHISKKRLEEIVFAELNNQDDRAAANKEVNKILDDYLKGVK